jgi:hypothetical protein
MKNLRCLTFTLLNLHINLFPYTLSQNLSPFSVNLQKGSLHQKKETTVDK